MAAKRISQQNVIAAGILSPLKVVTTFVDIEDPEEVCITKRHFVSKASRGECVSRQCRNKFSLLTVPRNCFKCGEVYCSKCLRQERRLNIFAQFDPQGKFYKVCKSCFESEQQTVGITRKLTESFKTHRSNHLQKNRICRRSEWGLAEERIINGFLADIKSMPGIVRTIRSLTFSFTNGKWKKPAKTMDVQEICRFCLKRFDMFLSRHLCSICGAAVCKVCSNTDLMVYIPDEVEANPDEKLLIAKLCVLYTTQRMKNRQKAPNIEPLLHEYLRICQNCLETKKRQQQQDATDGMTKQRQDDFWNLVYPFHESTMEYQRLIFDQMGKYEKLVNSLEDGSQRSESRSSNVKTLAKAQIDVADAMQMYLNAIQKSKAFTGISHLTSCILKNMHRSMALFYLENKSSYAELKNNLAEYLPAPVVEAVQAQVNKNALLCVHLILRQLGIEVLKLASRTSEEGNFQNIAVTLANSEQLVGEELKTVIEKDGEKTWEEQIYLSNELIKTEMKERPLITVNDWLMSHPLFLLNHIIEQSCTVLDKTCQQLVTKTTHSSLKKVKETLFQMKEEILLLISPTDNKFNNH